MTEVLPLGLRRRRYAPIDSKLQHPPQPQAPMENWLSSVHGSREFEPYLGGVENLTRKFQVFPVENKWIFLKYGGV